MLAQRSLNARMMLSFGALVLMTLIIGFASWMAIAALGDALEDSTTRSAVKLGLAGDIGTDASEMKAAQRGILLASMLKDSQQANAAKADFSRYANDVQKAIDTMRPMLVTARGRQITSDVERRLQQWRSVFDEYARACESGNLEQAEKVRAEKAAPLADALEQGGHDLIDQQQKVLEDSRQHGGETVTRNRWTTLVLVALSLALGTGVLFEVRRLSNSLRRLAEDLQSNAQQVALGSGQIAGSSQSVAKGASEQSASIEETSASTEELASMTHKNSENARRAAVDAAEAERHAIETDRALEEMRAAMGGISAASEKVAAIIKVIDEIAFQTNILSLNAAVEAARAGEAGMGFAVVADEVRNLAHRSAQAAKDTSALIQESIDTSRGGTGHVEKVSAAIRAIVQDAGRIRTLVDEINLGSEEQDRGFNQIAKAVAEMERVTQQNAAGAEESASASEEMASQADAMRQTVDRLFALVDGAASRA